MGFYDDGGVDFAQKQFDESRKRREKTAKSEDKFNKNLTILDGLLRVGDKVINKNADKLETEGILARSNYISQLEQSTNFNKEHNDYVSQGYSTKDILEFETKDLLEGYLVNEYGEGYDTSQFNDAINNISREWSSDPQRLESFQKQVDAHAQIPNMSPQELIEISRRQDAPPRSVGEFLGNSVLKLFKSHDENTLSEEDRLAKQRKLGGLLGQKFDNVKVAIEDYGKLGNPIDDLVTFMQENPEKIVFKNAKQAVVPEERTVGGKTTVINYLVTTAMDSNGNPITLGNPIPTTESVRDLGRKPLNTQQLTIGATKISEYIKGTNDSIIMDSYKEQYKERPTLLTESILNVEDYLVNQYGMQRNRALGVASKYILNQDSAIPNTDPTLFDIDFSLGQIDSEKVLQYADSVIKTKPDVLVNSELRNLRDSLVQTIADSGKETAVRDITAINSIMETKYGVIPAEDYNKKIIKTADIPEETKEIYQDILNTPIVGSVADVIFGEEFGDSTFDYIALVPVGGVAVTGTRTAIGKTVGAIAPKIGNQILKHPSMAKFIAKATKYADPTKKIRGKEAFIKNLNPVEKAVFRSMNAKGNIDTMLFMKRLSTIPGVYVQKSGLLPGFGSKFGKVTYGGIGAYMIYSSYIDKQEPTED